MGTFAKTQRIAPKDYELSKVQDGLANQIDALIDVKVMNGNLVSNIKVEGGQTLRITHGLKRKFVGYFITRVVGPNHVTVKDATTQPDSENFIYIVPSATGRIDLWVF